jgi:hypothetical protein
MILTFGTMDVVAGVNEVLVVTVLGIVGSLVTDDPLAVKLGFVVSIGRDIVVEAINVLMRVGVEAQDMRI